MIVLTFSVEIISENKITKIILNYFLKWNGEKAKEALIKKPCEWFPINDSYTILPNPTIIFFNFKMINILDDQQFWVINNFDSQQTG